MSLSQDTSDLAGPPWQQLRRRLHARFATGDFATGAELVRRIAEAADAADHHPGVDLRYSTVDVSLRSDDVGAVTERDHALARTVSAIAAELGVEPAEGVRQVLEIAVDALDIPAVRPFWRAVLGYEDAGTPFPVDPVSDPHGDWPLVWFQQMDAPRPQRNRIHLDVTLAPEDAQARIAAAVAAGGRVVSDAEAPSFWVLADPEGNEVCVCTEVGLE